MDSSGDIIQLWFDVESRYETTDEVYIVVILRCGLMQNQDMKQQIRQRDTAAHGCGLMQNQDMKQLETSEQKYRVVVV